MLKKITLITSIVAATVATPVFAGDVYVVGSIGYSRVDLDKATVDNDLTSAGATNVNSTLDKNDTGYKIQIGYQFNQNFTVEGGYVDLGKAKYSASYTGGNAAADAKASGINIAAIGILPINESFSVFGKLGLINAKVEISASATGPGGSASGTASATKWKPNFGIGGTYNINKQVGIRAEIERFSKLGDSDNTGESNVDMLSAGVMYKF